MHHTIHNHPMNFACAYRIVDVDLPCGKLFEHKDFKLEHWLICELANGKISQIYIKDDKDGAILEAKKILTGRF